MNSRVLFLAALVAVASARPQEFHDDVFHFSTNVHPEKLVKSSVVSAPVYQQQSVVVKSVPQYQQQVVVKSVPQYQQQVVVKIVPQYQQQVVVKAAPVYSQVHHVVQQQQPSVLFRSIEQEIPAVTSVHTHHVPVYSQVSSSQVSSQVVPTTSVVASRSFAVPQYNQYTSQYSGSQYYSGSSLAQPKFKILKQVQEFNPVGIYKTNYETENGISSAEQGTVKDIQAKEGPVASKEGSYSYTGPDGVVYSVNWIADEYGYRASGAHLPVAPEIPAEIQESLKLIKSQPQQQYDDNGNLVRTQLF